LQKFLHTIFKVLNMSVERVRAWLKRWGKDGGIVEFPVSTANVDLAAKAAGVIPARIAKSIAMRRGDGCVLVVAAGDTRINARKFKDTFNSKMKLCSPDETFAFTGYMVGGVCPFAIEHPQVEIFCDVSLKRFDTIFPACGSDNSTVELSCEELFTCARAADWVDVCTLPDEPPLARES
jgi:prolyl-tRNA editing enzyme YbaK/EbsC (Cys-tRNA(Pro) deacylase)